MSEKIEQYIVNLFAMVQKYGNIFVTSDGVHYRDEESAVGRCRQEMRLGRVVKFAHVSEADFPETWDELNKMMRLPDEEKPQVETKPSSQISSNDTDRAREALEKKRAKRQKADK